MSDAAAELNFPAGEDADAVMLGVLGQDVETASGVSPGTHQEMEGVRDGRRGSSFVALHAASGGSVRRPRRDCGR